MQAFVQASIMLNIVLYIPFGITVSLKVRARFPLILLQFCLVEMLGESLIKGWKTSINKFSCSGLVAASEWVKTWPGQREKVYVTSSIFAASIMVNI